jgi:hypothetical protein
VSNPPAFRCPWCLRETHNQNDVEHKFCPCCGFTEATYFRPVGADPQCEHRTKSTLAQLWVAGVRLVRRDPWADGNYLELLDVGGFMAPYGLEHGPLEWAGTPPDVAMAPTRIPLWGLPRGGWEAYTGPTVDERRMTIETDAQGRRWLLKPAVREKLTEKTADEIHGLALFYLAQGVVMGARSRGLDVTQEEVEAALRAGTVEQPGLDHVMALLERKRVEQGLPPVRQAT